MNNEKGPSYEMPEEFSLNDYQTESDSEDSSSAETSGNNKLTQKNKLIIRIVAIVAVVALIVAGIVVLSKSDILDEFHGDDENVVTITMDDLEMMYAGYDGSGAILVTVNVDKVKPRVLKAMGYDEDETSVGIAKRAEYICNAYMFMLCDPDNDYTDKDIDFIGENTVNGTLTNGQTVKIVMYNSVERKNEIYESLGNLDATEEPLEVIFKFEEVTYEIHDFPSLVTIDIFDDVNIYTTGEDGSFSVELEYTGDLEGIDSETFTITGKNGSLKYGDTINITVSKDTESVLKFYDGIKLERNTMEYVIE